MPANMVEVDQTRVETKADADAPSDLELIAAINGGDPAAFEALYFRYRGWVASLAYRFTADEYAAQDVVQETFLYFLKKFPGFRLTAHLKTFLFPAVRNLSIAARSKKQRCQGTETDHDHLEQMRAPDFVPTDAEGLSAVLGSLPEEQRDVLLLRFVDDLSLQEVADAMEIPLGTVKSRLHNALKALRQDQRTRDFFER